MDAAAAAPLPEAPQRKHQAEAVDPLFAAAFQQAVAGNIAAGRAGHLRLHPEIFWLPVSENCNLRCIGCDDVITGFRKEYLAPADVRRLLSASAGQASFSEIDLTSGEPLLHPQLSEVIDICHELHPKAVVSVVSNGTIPVRGKYREAYARLDSIGLSIDGATAEVFEAVRVGASFERFVQTVKDVVALRDQTGRPAEIQLCFTACAMNLHQLPEVVRLGKSWGVNSVYAQPMEMNIAPIRDAIGHLHLDHMGPAERTRWVDEAVALGRELGLEVAASDGLYPRPKEEEKSTELQAGPSLAFEEKVAKLGVGVRRRSPDGELTLPHVRQCQYPWTQAPGIRKMGAAWHTTLCCYMSEAANTELAARYDLHDMDQQSMLDLYNGAGYWQFREDLAAGLTHEACGDCAAALTHGPSLLQHLAWRIDALCVEHGLRFPGGDALREQLMQPQATVHQARKLVNHLHQAWWQPHPQPRPVWLQELMAAARELGPPKETAPAASGSPSA